MYLENTNAALFPNDGAYAGASEYNPSASSADIVRCILGAGAAQTSLAADLRKFRCHRRQRRGQRRPAQRQHRPERQLRRLAQPDGRLLLVAALRSARRKSLRAYYEYQFAHPDTYAP